MPPWLSLIKTESAPSDPRPRQNAPGETGALRRDPPSSPTLIQDAPTLARAPGVHADSQLAAVIAAWSTLSEGVRAQILRLIETGEVAL